MQTVKFSADFGKDGQHTCYSIREGDLITWICPICGKYRDFNKNHTPRLRKLSNSTYFHNGLSLPIDMFSTPPKEV